MDPIKPHYTHDLLANGTVKLRFEGRNCEHRIEKGLIRRQSRPWNEKHYGNNGEKPQLVRHFKGENNDRIEEER